MHKSHKKHKKHRNHHKQNTIENLKEKTIEDEIVLKNINAIVINEDDDEKLFKVEKNEIMGRYVVASKDLNPGTILIKENPIVVGPCSDNPPICLGCYYNFNKDLDLTPYKCPGCNWPLCSAHCSGINRPYGHTKTECNLLANCKEGTGSWYATITPLRCLLLEKNDPTAYKKLLQMASLNEVRRKRPTIWETNEKYVVNRIRNAWKLTEFSEEQIHTICGILEVNAFEVGQHGISIRALYPTAFLLAHDCVPNTTHTDEQSTYRLTIRTSTAIKKNQMIFISYAYTLQSTMQRRQHLYDSKFFWCECKRCNDPTELGTNAGTLLCPRCRGGHVLSTSPLESNAVWKCTNSMNKCPGYTIPANTIRLLNEKISDEVERIDGNDVSSFEEFLLRYRNVLHPNHFHCVGVKHSLSQLYGKITGYMIQDLPQTLLERKLNICKEILTLFNILEPGLSRLRGITLYELHAPLMILATRNFERKLISKPELKGHLKEVVHCLQDAAKILSFEPDNSVEGVMACAAKDALHRIKDWEKILGKIIF